MKTLKIKKGDKITTWYGDSGVLVNYSFPQLEFDYQGNVCTTHQVNIKTINGELVDMADYSIEFVDTLTPEQEIFLSDEMYLPIQYKTLLTKPNYKGDGQHSVNELQQIIKQFQEYCHQQQIIKQKLKEHFVETKFNLKLS